MHRDRASRGCGQTLASAVQSPVLFRIAADLTRMQVQVAVDESDVGGLTPGVAASFAVESYPDEMFHGTLSQLRMQPVADTSFSATAVATPGAATASGAVPAVVTYIAIVDVANPEERLRPGMTAEVLLPGSRRDRVVRIPNGALAFRPSPDVWHALAANGTPQPKAPRSNAPGEERLSEVWTFDGTHLAAISVRSWLADDGWTEVLGGEVHTGDALVTSAEVEKHRRL